ncbi:MAG: biotin/lipoyl-containing protein [Candidatus Poseidoniia archaeon]|jgi:acetyl/propionyl-CoA carboxylase alpha subunit|nr:biotin/lipoyl-containing protein [Candidatus Poseidoniia archaeon]MDP6847027.1 biotin/lipoyl-containing protein [Candidatus Poseidoniia archaeon]
MSQTFRCGDSQYAVALRQRGDEFAGEVDGEPVEGHLEQLEEGLYEVDAGAGVVRVHVVRDGRRTWVHCQGQAWELEHIAAARSGEPEAASDLLLSPITGKLVELRVSAGDSVTQGDTLAVLEAMKMEHRLRAPRGGTVAQVTATAPGGQVRERELVIELEAA